MNKIKLMSGFLLLAGISLFSGSTVYAADSATITGTATLTNGPATELKACFYPADGTGQSHCANVGSSNQYEITLSTAYSYIVDLEGTQDTFQFKSDAIGINQLNDGTLNLSLRVSTFTKRALNIFGIPVANIPGQVSTNTNDTNSINPSNIQYSASGFTVIDPNYYQWSSTYETKQSDNNGLMTFRYLNNLNYPNGTTGGYGTYAGGGFDILPTEGQTQVDQDFYVYYSSYSSRINVTATNSLMGGYVKSLPELSWPIVSGAVAYNVYRESSNEPRTQGSLVGPTSFSTSTNIFSEVSPLVDGVYKYMVVAANSTGDYIDDSRYPLTVTLDRVLPSVSGLTMSKSTITSKTGPVTINVATAVDNGSGGIRGGEFYVDSDPGQGGGFAMTMPSGSSLTANHAFTGLAKGTHTLYARAQDYAGNWSAVISTTFVIK
jgi:hypothetical protein